MSDSAAKKVLVVFGTRPEAIKLAPVILALRASGKFRVLACAFRQHGAMLVQAFSAFGLKPDFDLKISLNDREFFGAGILRKGWSGIKSAWGLLSFVRIIRKEKPDFLAVQGDTFTAFLAALIGFYLKVKIIHIEAGLRTWDKSDPFPEEAHRRLIAPLADIHFASTEDAKNNLLKENIPKNRIFVTGNTALDAVRLVSAGKDFDAKWAQYFGEKYGLDFSGEKKIILVTAHRRENFGEGLKNICEALLDISKKRPDILFVYPVHPNPNVHNMVFGMLRGVPGILLTEPLDYEPFLFLMGKAFAILSDSGGIQEEISLMGKPILVLRKTTERPEAVAAGNAMLVGAEKGAIVRETLRLLDEPVHYASMAKKHGAFGDGFAAEKITIALNNFPLSG